MSQIPETTTRQIEDYLKRLRWALARLPDEDRRDIVEEIRSHFLDRLGSGDGPTFESVASQLGEPEVYARSFRDNYEISLALSSGSAWMMLFKAATLVGRGTRAVLGFIFFLLAYVTAFGLVATAVLELFFPEHVGLWTSSDPFGFNIGYVSDPNRPELTEHLGSWIIPVAGVAGLLAYFGTTRLLRRFLASFRS